MTTCPLCRQRVQATPELLPRSCGHFLAVSPSGCVIVCADRAGLALKLARVADGRGVAVAVCQT